MTPYEIARGEIGVKEGAGALNCARVLEYLDACPSLPDDMQEQDSTPWCSAFVNWCCQQAGIKGSGSAAARSWLQIGERVTEPITGDILIFKRGGSPTAGHVCFFVKKTGDKYFCLGGNQGDSASEQWYSSADLLGIRRLT